MVFRDAFLLLIWFDLVVFGIQGLRNGQVSGSPQCILALKKIYAAFSEYAPQVFAQEFSGILWTGSDDFLAIE